PPARLTSGELDVLREMAHATPACARLNSRAHWAAGLIHRRKPPRKERKGNSRPVTGDRAGKCTGGRKRPAAGLRKTGGAGVLRPASGVGAHVQAREQRLERERPGGGLEKGRRGRGGWRPLTPGRAGRSVRPR